MIKINMRLRVIYTYIFKSLVQSMRVNKSLGVVSVKSSVGLLSHVCEEEDDCEDQAEGSYHYIADSQEIVLSSQGIGSRQHKALLSFVASHIIYIIDFHLVSSLLQVLFKPPIKFSEIRESCGSHPNNEMLYRV